MKFKKKFKFVILMIIISNFLIDKTNSLRLKTQDIQEQKQPWCWTKPMNGPEKKFLNPSLGGLNWGFCSSESNPKNQKIKFKVTVNTANFAGAGASGNFYITIFGKSGRTKEMQLTSSGFAIGESTVITLNGKNIGDINKIRIRNGGNDNFRCTTVRVEVNSKFWDFECNDFISCPQKCSEDMNLAGNQRYDFIVKTANQAYAGCQVPLWVQIIGVLGKTPKTLLTENGFGKGSIDKFEIQTKDVGFVYGLIIYQELHDMWVPERIVVKRGGRDESVFDPKGKILNCPLKCMLILMNKNPGDSGKFGGATGGGFGITGTDNGSLDNDFGGGGLSGDELKRLVTLTCDDVVKDNVKISPKFATNKANFDWMIGKCPPNCLDTGKAKIYGIGIHPEESSICRSAIIDKAVPPCGGLIGIGVAHGLTSYDASPDKLLGVQVETFKKSEKSFFTYKIDNVDFAETDIRILGADGLPAYTGRVEFRLDGYWGSVSSRGSSNSAARLMCRKLGYIDGIMKNPPPEEDHGSFCSTYKGENYCGSIALPIHYMGMNCEGYERDIMQCYRDMASGVSHAEDMIIECTNVNFNVAQLPDVGTIRLSDNDGMPSYTGVGRLEYFKGTWGSVCNIKFNDNAAKVACKQMGYESGRMAGTPGQNGACANHNGKDYCGIGSSPITISEIACSGSESNMRECGGKGNPSNCNHQMDIVLDCEGTSGDPTGASQKSTNQLQSPPAPSLGKLPLPPIVTAECKTTGSRSFFRGDQGNIYLVSCPAGCAEMEGGIWGTGVYTTDSSICKAAIHSGVNQNMGGLILFIKTSGISKYEGSINREITSSPYGGWKSSFIITKPNSVALFMSQSFNNKPKLDPGAIFPKMPGLGALGKYFGDKCSFLQTGLFSMVKIVQKMISKIGNGNNKDSQTSGVNQGKKMLGDKAQDSKSKIPAGVLEWISSPDLIFDGANTDVKTNSLPGVDKTGNGLKMFSIALKAEMIKATAEDQTLIGHSGCGGYALAIEQDYEIVFKIRCENNDFKSGFRMPLLAMVHIAVTYDGNQAIFYIDGNLYNKVQKKFDFKCDKNFDIGRYSQAKDEYFNGKIEFVLFYTRALKPEEVKAIFIEGVNSHDQPSGSLFTVDNRHCIRGCTLNPVPGQIGSPSPPNGAALGQPDYGSSGIIEGIEGEEGKSDDFNNDQVALSISCEALAIDNKFSGETGKSYRLKCPKNCKKYKKGNVLGTQIYVDSSSICKAAAHSGFLNDQTGGIFMMTIANGEDFYQSSNQNGIQSAAYGPHIRSIIFKEAAPVKKINCDTTASEAKFKGPPGTSFRVYCNTDCSKIDHNVFGNDIYTEDSSICQAAIHKGYMSDKGGEVIMKIEVGLKDYKSIKKNGILSKAKSEYVRSFKIHGDQSNVCEFFKEKYTPPNLFAHWKIVDSSTAINKPSEWSFNTHPTQYGLAIRQNSNIKSIADYSYGTQIINRNFDCTNALYKVKIYFDKSLSKSAIFFRFYNENNFYAAELNYPGENLRILKKYEGQSQILISTKEIAFIPNIWYTFSIVFYGYNLQLWLQTGNLRNNEMIFNITDNDIQRGGVGVATNEKNYAIFDGLTTEEYNPIIGVNKYSGEKRIWDNCLIGNTKGKRTSFCKKFLGGYEAGVKRCEKVYNYCDKCCEQIIPQLETILSYACVKGCYNEAKAIEKRNHKQKLENQEILDAINGVWHPKIGEKADFKPKQDDSHFLKATISEINKSYKNEKNSNEVKLTVKYSDDNEEKVEEIVFPNPNLTPCGKSLIHRDDC